ncbi:MAG TPA: hypothetical protein VN030_14000 [Cellvibrio sp.]|nr:hypothetical protein [Cellvibrio sp.]
MTSNKFTLFTSICFAVFSPYASASPSLPTPECIRGITHLLKIVGRSEFFDESPDDFIKNSEAFLHIAKNETDKESRFSSRNTKIVLKSENWLDRGTLLFSNDKEPSSPSAKAKLTLADFDIKPSCFPNQKDFLALATKNIKGKFADTRTPKHDGYTLRRWAMPAPEQDWERVIEVLESDKLLSIKVLPVFSPSEEAAE